MSFVGDRLRLARTAAGLSQRELAEEVAGSSSFISDVELGKKEPGEIFVEALGEVLGVRPEFFYREAPAAFDPEEVNFRHRASTPEALKAHISAKATLFRLVAERLDYMLDFPPYNVPRIAASTPAEIEVAARRCRDHWGVGQDVPIDNMVRVAENAGVVVTESREADKVDAFSAAKGRLGVIVLNTSKESTSKSRWNVAHELGHLVMHEGIVTGTREREREADIFAAAFLLPAAGFSREFAYVGKCDWPHMFELKRHWKVSVAAIIRRAYELDLIRAVDYRRLYKSLSAQGWRTGEPHEPPYEKPELMSMAVSTLEQEFDMSLLDVAEELGWTRRKAEEITGFEIPLPVPENVRSLSGFRADKEESA